MKKTIHLLLSLLSIGILSEANAQKVFVLTTNNMFYWMDAANPSMMSAPASLSGLGSGEEIVGMDVRPATGDIYLLGYHSAMQKAQLYRLDTSNRMLTAIGSGISSFALSGRIGFDFNPTVDRIRVISSDEHDYRLHPVTGALVATDGMLMYANGDVNVGVNPNIGTGAYTNSYIGSTATTLYNYDDSLNVLTIQNPPNNGIQNTVGMSGIMVNWNDPSSDMDIYFDPVSKQNRAYLAANTSSDLSDSLYMINLSTGMATGVAAFSMEVRDIAVMIDRKAPAFTGRSMWALSSNGNILHFNSSDPSYIISATPVTGLVAGQTLVGMDMRLADLEVYALGYNASTMAARVYKLNTMNATLTPVSADSIVNIDLTGNVGVDFNPVADRMRVVTSNNKNYRINQLTGLLAATDSMLSYKTGDAQFGADPDVATVAYTNSIVAPTSTVLYAYDDSLNLLLTQDPPNAGLLNTVGSSGIMVNGMDRSSDMDIFFDHGNATNIAYLAANTSGNNDMLYTINLTTGMTTALGTIGWGVAVRDLVVQLDSTPAPAAVSETKDQMGTFSAYPNPVNGTLNISFESEASAQVTLSIADVTGRTIEETLPLNAVSGKNTFAYDTSRLPGGVYFVTVSNGSQTHTFKVIK